MKKIDADKLEELAKQWDRIGKNAAIAVPAQVQAFCDAKALRALIASTPDESQSSARAEQLPRLADLDDAGKKKVFADAVRGRPVTLNERDYKAMMQAAGAKVRKPRDRAKDKAWEAEGKKRAMAETENGAVVNHASIKEMFADLNAPAEPKGLREALTDALDVCRSAMSIVRRRGKETAWDTFAKRLGESIVNQSAALASRPSADREKGKET
jgi:hypothetical protein